MILAGLLVFTFSFSSSAASGAPASCQKLETQQLCAMPEKKSAAQEACEIEQKSHQCEEYVKLHPELKTSGKLKNCSDLSVCENSQGTQDFLKICATQMGEAWKDMALGIFMFLSGQAGLPSEQDLAKQDFFKNCTTPECKRQMLGPFQKYFSAEEIQGHRNDKNLNPADPAHQNYLQGYSAAVLYRKLLLKLKKEAQTRSLNEKFIEPWSGQAARLPLSFNELIDQALQKSGITHAACFKPEVVTEMRCYAFFSILDPSLAAGAALKLTRIAGLAGKEVALAIKGTEASSAARATETAGDVAITSAKAELPSSGNTQVDIWQAREAGQHSTAEAMEAKLLEDMKSNDIKSVKSLAMGRLSPPLLLEFDNGVKGVWKSSETPGLNPHGEIFAYRLDRHLGENMVPATIERDLNGKPGTFQYFVDEAKPGKVDDPESFIFFDYLIENGDRHSDNYLVRPDGRKVAIDHGLALDAWHVPDFPRHVEAVIDQQKKVDAEVDTLRAQFDRAQRGGVGKDQLEKLAANLKKAESEAKISRAKAQQEIAAMGVSARATVKIADTTPAQWNKVLQSLSETEKKKFFERKDKAMKAIEKAYDYLGEGIYTVGPTSAKFRKAKELPERNPYVEQLNGSGL